MSRERLGLQHIRTIHRYIADYTRKLMDLMGLELSILGGLPVLGPFCLIFVIFQPGLWRYKVGGTNRESPHMMKPPVKGEPGYVVAGKCHCSQAGLFSGFPSWYVSG